MSDKIFLSIVIPAYKEESRIHKILDAIEKFYPKVDFEIEVIVVVDGKVDKTAESAKKFAKKLPNFVVIDRKKNMGKGYSVKEGVLRANGKYILFCDADNSTPVEQVEKLLKHIKKSSVVIGSRYVKGGHVTIPQSFTRRMGSRVLNLVIRFFAVRGIKDTQCGFKLFEREAAREVFKRQTFDRWSFDIELLAIARKLGYKISEIGITWHADPHSVLNPIKAGIKMIRDSVVVRLNIWRGKYR